MSLHSPAQESVTERGQVEDPWLEPVDAALLAARGRPRRFRRGQQLMYQGQLSNEVLLLRRGRVKVFAMAGGKEAVLAFRGPGDVLGELSGVDDGPRSASAVAIDSVEALALTGGEFRAFLAETPPAALALLRVLSRRLRDADAKRIEFRSLNTVGRIAVRLLEMSERFGRDDGGAVVIELPLSQEDLAGWTGSSVESVGRGLHMMRSLGWIETRRREIRIMNVEAVRNLTM
jgi:CRP/FNR family transcriptional regulator, cyclic AMP receptor protein